MKNTSLASALSFFLIVPFVFAAETPVPGSKKIAEDDILFLTKGVEGIPQSGVPGPLCVFGDNAAAVIAGKNGNQLAPVLAAAKFGKGRVVAFGHGGYLSSDMFSKSPDCERLAKNILDWLGNNRKEVRIAVVDNSKLADHLTSLDYDVQALRNLTDPEATGKFQILIMDAARLPEDQVRRITKFIDNGGGLLTAMLGWGWLQVSGKTDLKTEMMGNVLLGPMGIVWADGYLGTTTEKDGVKLFGVTQPPRLLHVQEAFTAIMDHEKGERKLSPGEIAQALQTIETGIRSIPDKQASVFAPLTPLMKREIVPTDKNKIKKESMISDILAMTLQTERYLKKQRTEGLPKGGVPALKAAEDFPGSVPADAKMIEKTVEIDTKIPDWHSLGLYAAPGQTITVKVSKEHVSPNGRNALGVRIGCHRDGIWGHKDWGRYPEITLEVPIRSEETKIANPFGGLVYITVPRKYEKSNAEVKVSGCVESPLYVHGKTSVEDWKNMIRNAPGPWGELASDRVILSLPSEHLRDLDDPAAVMEFWNKVLDYCAELCARPVERDRPERIVCDRQISAGYMHSGYPVMTHMDVEKYFVTLKDNPDKGWGFFHEFGHNHQSGDWTFDGTVEVTVNLFTLYVFEKLFNRDAAAARGRGFSDEDRKKMREKFFADGSPFDKWKNDPFLALIMYVDIQKEFGWESFTKVFKEYRELKNEERPKNDDEKRDQWIVRMSKMIDRNLGPYFDRWGVPVSQAAKDSIKDLPAWNPYE